jgi:hypothetical protein
MILETMSLTGAALTLIIGQQAIYLLTKREDVIKKIKSNPSVQAAMQMVIMIQALPHIITQFEHVTKMWR